MEITYLEHSGFLLEDEKRCYVFDLWRDEKGVVDEKFKSGKTLWFFISHAHGDHMNPTIGKYDTPETRYFAHTDVQIQGIEEEHYIEMAVGDKVTVEGVSVSMYGSTDAGGSFEVNTGKEHLFHAGDLNWWHWLGDTEENNLEARGFWDNELERIVPMKEVDILFFPIDARLEGAREWGILEFLQQVSVKKLLVPMHMHDAGWVPSERFETEHPGMPIWVPMKKGDTHKVD